MAKYDKRNNTEFNCAITFNDPIKRNISTTTKHTTTAPIGFPEAEVPFVTNLNTGPI